MSSLYIIIFIVTIIFPENKWLYMYKESEKIIKRAFLFYLYDIYIIFFNINFLKWTTETYKNQKK